ncbi:rhodanese-like domain-containing protein [Aestuariicoccus sp. MJ-SS9]|uniref:rhodanese-like domain-containing protein n=1 Tax=Aestuariicoccus sp. MJ-SS9 TaxID=3079855 RepID=UPI002907767A|nr:rhodanese-like domain-containing protein [Aestuariicoccus sp. MJ-SS9]MDU8911176.1 rhodanese-like domain-containing protein [Aestuariicoccus sp. MJ-SS9]
MNKFAINRGISAAFAITMIAATGAWAGDLVRPVSLVEPASLPDKKRTALDLYLTAEQAGAFLAGHDDALLVDIRTRAEVSFVGIADEADKNIPYMVMDDFWEFDDDKGAYKMMVNPEFSDAIADLVAARGLSRDAPILLMCRSGSRSARAADLLGQLGYTAVYSVVDGFEGDKSPDGGRNLNGWKNAGLAWSYTIRPEQHY